ncbi:MAG: ribosome-binding factor A [Candidatus Aquicultor secundus]|uniref:Ribosome-binding factor A n=1 Tax=Candidatus Aquicultor secundus TaxID=1973895 RepID=A0A2M7T6U8_9ACTN|nr:30S ribosome-binding factor RbfA [Candidatus Aquicultor secundus]NCO65568.1 30S ribosome-binding factor RbfA [Solirubrobacter sp.]OIO88947.1 MAG: ribosome-binding factor A [Candidatus Aquicultor secundus]PIU26173.1 MAG: ribosome-binding factor A [Candidatus Aquicultor secundus]PIW22801.1 MAG: ribosome-binding factor A [Candidatus Aquicultor secundus]PIX51439.1 MAG: ribosome-binding factor A [Candidatus Aquicultor secundus]
METARTRKVGELIKEEISEIIQKEIKDPRIGFVTITGVDVTPGLRFAHVFISVLGNKKQKESTLKGLQSSSGFLRKELSKRIRLKYFPELKFEFDPSIEAGRRIDKIIRKLHKHEEKRDKKTK